MKFVLLLFYIVIGFQCNNNKRIANEKIRLKNYSYLLIASSFQPNFPDGYDNLHNYRAEGTATGFFVKRNQRLLFISAYHVLTTRDIYKGGEPDIDYEYWILRYWDKSGNVKFYKIPTVELKKLNTITNPMETPDLLILDLTDSIQDIQVKSLESYLKGSETAEGNAQNVFTYGYPVESSLTYPPLPIKDFAPELKPVIFQGLAKPDPVISAKTLEIGCKLPQKLATLS